MTNHGDRENSEPRSTGSTRFEAMVSVWNAITYASLAGLCCGAIVGGVVGSIVPIYGTIIGAICGSFVGFLAGTLGAVVRGGRWGWALSGAAVPFAIVLPFALKKSEWDATSLLPLLPLLLGLLAGLIVGGKLEPPGPTNGMLKGVYDRLQAAPVQTASLILRCLLGVAYLLAIVSAAITLYYAVRGWTGR